MAGLASHLATGTTSVCRCWSLVRADGLSLGFTDHDRDLGFEGIVFRAESGLTAGAIQQSTGLSVDNSEAIGALSDAAISEADIQAGRYDGANFTSWLVNWNDPTEREVLFCGTLGEIRRSGGAFQAELRGLTERLNQPMGWIYQTPCAAVLGDALCRFDLSLSGYATEVPVEIVQENRVFRFGDLAGFDDRWFERGRLLVRTGRATGLVGLVKNDRLSGDGRSIELWETLGQDVASGDVIRIEAGCDKQAETCRLKFNNFLNFRGFPHIPGEDWLMRYPVSGAGNDGGSVVS